jgi:CDP-diacylglycerol--glycerol-3-phosphate 3-phosphatidyltransferase
VNTVTGLSALRIALVAPVMALVLAGPRTSAAFVGAAAVFAVAASTDFLDGYLARRWRLTTTMGSFLDTTADKVVVTGALIALVSVGRCSPWLATVIVSRELAVLALRGVVAANGTVMAPSLWGKLKANVQFLAVILAMLRPGGPWGPWYADQWALAAAAVLAVTSAAQYLLRFRSGASAPVGATGRSTSAPELPRPPG